MNYKGKEIQKDDFSGRLFGKDNQLEVLGWFDYRNNTKVYVLSCSTCSKDQELHGDGLFQSSKSNLLAGTLPCGCSPKHHYTEEQNKIRINRICEERGVKFLGWSGEYKTKSGYTKLLLECPAHGVFDTSYFGNMMKKTGGTQCSRCIGKKPDEYFISRFKELGKYHESVEFSRNERLDNRGTNTYWNINCPICGVTAVAHTSNILRGMISCGCNLHNIQDEGYINVLYDSGVAIAAKFGISRNTKQRLYMQNYNSVYDIINIYSYTFPDVVSCRNAEYECKKSLICGIVSKTDMWDGFSETTNLNNIDKIREIFIKHKGREVKNVDYEY